MKVAVFGCGNMSSAMVVSWKRYVSELEFITYTPSVKRAKSLASKVQGTFIESFDDLPEVDVALIACKPNQVKELAKDLNKKISNCIVISILASIKVEVLQELFGSSKIVRVMPNTPLIVDRGVNAVYFSKGIEESFKKKLLAQWSLFSKTYLFDDEKMIDVITPFSGSGPAYIFEMARIFIDKMEKMNVPKEYASSMMIETMAGACELMKNSKESPETLRNNVTSKKGVTQAGLDIFNNEDYEKLLGKVIDAAYARSLEMSK